MAGTSELRRGPYWRIGAWMLAASLLLVPLVAMQFTDAVNWGAEDFIAAAALIGGAGLAIEITVRLARSTVARLVSALAVAAAIALTWAELAVGVF